jgi:hypothetical protein
MDGVSKLVLPDDGPLMQRQCCRRWSRRRGGKRRYFLDKCGTILQETCRLLAPQDMHESGIFAFLPPGQFTVILAGKDDGTGIGLVEIYNLK